MQMQGFVCYHLLPNPTGSIFVHPFSAGRKENTNGKG